jgi:nitrate reductase gamma subunit
MWFCIGFAAGAIVAVGTLILWLSRPLTARERAERERELEEEDR